MIAQFSAYVGTPAGPFDEREAVSLEGILVHVAELRAKHPWPVVVFQDGERIAAEPNPVIASPHGLDDRHMGLPG